ncbi:IclR family transcriptional regulator [Nocardioides sp. KR10-350]|uniref:IclR family transcriptional regulator n=1 Tax=Nocardioides cheoyonin TaxID=3156615 RepID=UPI0032B55751
MSSSRVTLQAVNLVAERGEITVKELALALGLAPSTAHRILQDCQACGFVRQDQPRGPYVRGPAMLEIALLASRSLRLRDAIGPVLQELFEEVDDTVGVLVLEGRSARVVQSLTRDRAGAVVSRVGRTFPAHSVAGGRAMLAVETAEKRRRRLGAVPPSMTDGTRLTWEQLDRDLDTVRRRGWAYGVSQSDPSIGAVAAAVCLSNGDPVAAISVLRPRSRLSTRAEVDCLAPHVVSAANRAQSRLRGGE